MPNAKPPISRRAVVLAPLAIVGSGGIAAWCLLNRMRQGIYDPHALPSALLGRKMPAFDLPALTAAGQTARGTLTSNEITAARRPSLINFFASWCVPCVEEASALMELKAQNIPIYGIAYKDDAAAAARFLKQQGDPYVRVGSDLTGTVAIDFGLYGVPETYALDASGVVRRRWAGAMTTALAHSSLLPLLKNSLEAR